jgi:hypothetical protein
LSGLALAQQPIGEVVATDASVKGSVVLAGAGTQVMSGSSVTAGDSTAKIKLARGGEVRVCPGTTVSLAVSASGQQLTVGMSTGAVEMHYALASSADSVMTPDFRILLPGPGEFHFAFSADARGDACVRSLPSNSASVIVSELMGDGTYQVQPNDEVYFHDGRVDKPLHAGGACGCPPPPPPVMRAEATPAPQPAPKRAERKPAETNPRTPTPEPPVVADRSLTRPVPPAKPNDIQVELEQPFVFPPSETVPAPAPLIARVRFSTMPHGLFPVGAVVPPAPPAVAKPAPPPQQARAKKPDKGDKNFLGRVRAFFASIFH